MIFSGYSLRFTSVLPISARQFTQIISQTLKISFQEAEELKLKYGLEKRYKIKIQDGTEKEIEPGKIFEILLPALDNLVSQIKKYLDYYQTHITHEHLSPDGRGIKKILLCGGGANLKGITEFLSIQLRTPVELANPWTNILEIPFKELPELSYEKSLEYTTALGLALRGIKEK
jgi:Tfp pilus assembly PilM family ATPase